MLTGCLLLLKQEDSWETEDLIYASVLDTESSSGSLIGLKIQRWIKRGLSKTMLPNYCLISSQTPRRAWISAAGAQTQWNRLIGAVEERGRCDMFTLYQWKGSHFYLAYHTCCALHQQLSGGRFMCKQAAARSYQWKRKTSGDSKFRVEPASIEQIKRPRLLCWWYDNSSCSSMKMGQIIVIDIESIDFLIYLFLLNLR